MAENAVVRPRISKNPRPKDVVLICNKEIKEEATIVLASMGLTVSDAFRLMLMRVAKEKALPFELLIPNEETIQAMKETREGKNLESFDSVDDLMNDLNA